MLLAALLAVIVALWLRPAPEPLSLARIAGQLAAELASQGATPQRVAAALGAAVLGAVLVPLALGRRQVGWLGPATAAVLVLPLGWRLSQEPVALLAVLPLVVAAGSDAATRLLPYRLAAAALVLGLATAPWRGGVEVALNGALWGGVLASVVYLVPVLWSGLSSGRLVEPLGFGDVVAAAMVGMLVAPPDVPEALAVGLLLAGLAAGLRVAVCGPEARAELPLVPYLAAGALPYLVV